MNIGEVSVISKFQPQSGSTGGFLRFSVCYDKIIPSYFNLCKRYPKQARAELCEAQHHLNASLLNPITQGFSDQRLLPGGGSLGPQSYIQLILASFWTHGTIIDQFIVKGVHQ